MTHVISLWLNTARRHAETAGKGWKTRHYIGKIQRKQAFAGQSVAAVAWYVCNISHSEHRLPEKEDSMA